MDGWRSRAKALSRLYLVPCMQKAHIKDLQLQYVLLHLIVVIGVFLGKRAHRLNCGQREHVKEMIMCNVYTMFTPSIFIRVLSVLHVFPVSHGAYSHDHSPSVTLLVSQLYNIKP